MDQIHPLTTYRLRQTPPLTQEQLAKRVGVSKVSVSRWETGQRKPEQHLVTQISAVTGIPPAELRPDLATLFGAGRGSAKPRRAKSRAA